MDGMFSKSHRRETPDLNIVPILDMLVCVIFFLILTTSFMKYTKQTVPPSAVSTITNPVAPPPLTPKLMCVKSKTGTGLRLLLTWSGTNPGQLDKETSAEVDDVLNNSKEIIDSFMQKFPSEKTIQIGLGADVSYQTLITIMDAAKEKMPDMILFSYQEAQARADKL